MAQAASLWPSASWQTVLNIDLTLVRKKYEGLDATELAISESQERMAVVIDTKDLETVLKLASEENLEATDVGRVTDTGRMRLYWRGSKIVDITRDFLDTNGAPQEAAALVQSGSAHETQQFSGGSLQKTIENILSDLNVCSQKALGERFDSTIGAATVLMPFGGSHAASPAQAMAARVPSPEGETDTATLMAFGFDPYLSERDPFTGSVYAIVTSVAKLVAAGADIDKTWLTLQEYFPRLGTDAARWGRPLSALLGAYYAQKNLGIAAIGGKDSMSGSFMELDVPATLVSFAAAATETVISPEFKKTGSKIYLLEIERDKDGLPDFGDVKKKLRGSFRAHPGRARALRLCRGAGRCTGGAVQDGLWQPHRRPRGAIALQKLTESAYGAVVLEAAEPLEGFTEIGQTTREFALVWHGQKADLAQAFEAWRKTAAPRIPRAGGKQGRRFDACLICGTFRNTSQSARGAPQSGDPGVPGHQL